MRILVAEDSFTSRRLLCRFLEPFGEIDVAINGREALQAVTHEAGQGKRYDLICLDIMMPEMDGQKALKEIRRVEHSAGFPVGTGSKVVMTTSMEDKDSIRKAFHHSADGYVRKPIKKNLLISTLKDLGLDIEVPL